MLSAFRTAAHRAAFATHTAAATSAQRTTSITTVRKAFPSVRSPWLHNLPAEWRVGKRARPGAGAHAPTPVATATASFYTPSSSPAAVRFEPPASLRKQLCGFNPAAAAAAAPLARGAPVRLHSTTAARTLPGLRKQGLPADRCTQVSPATLLTRQMSKSSFPVSAESIGAARRRQQLRPSQATKTLFPEMRIRSSNKLAKLIL